MRRRTAFVLKAEMAFAGSLVLFALCVAGCGPFGARVEDGHPPAVVGTYQGQQPLFGWVSISLRADGTYAEELWGWPGLDPVAAEGNWVVEGKKLVLTPFVYAVRILDFSYDEFNRQSLEIRGSSDSGYAFEIQELIYFEKVRE
jgi:hypothetical protein